MFSNNGITLRDSLFQYQQQQQRVNRSRYGKLLTGTSDVVVDVSVSVATTACKHRQALETLDGGKDAMYGTILSLSPCTGGAPPSPGAEDPGPFRGGGSADTSLLPVEEAGSVEQRAVVEVVMTKSFKIVKTLYLW